MPNPAFIWRPTMPTTPLTRFLLLAGAALLLQACATGSGGTPVAKGLSAKGTDRYDVKTNLVSGYSTRNRGGDSRRHQREMGGERER